MNSDFVKVHVGVGPDACRGNIQPRLFLSEPTYDQLEVKSLVPERVNYSLGNR